MSADGSSGKRGDCLDAGYSVRRRHQFGVFHASDCVHVHVIRAAVFPMRSDDSDSSPRSGQEMGMVHSVPIALSCLVYFFCSLPDRFFARLIIHIPQSSRINPTGASAIGVSNPGGSAGSSPSSLPLRRG